MTLNAWPKADAIHLVLSSLGAVLVDAQGVRSVRAEDATGGFGLWPGHEDLLAVLSVGLLSWRDAQDAWHWCALRGGVLTLQRGVELQIASREAVLGDDPEQLEGTVLELLRQRQQTEDDARRESHQIEVQLLRQLQPGRTGTQRTPGVWP
jgi:F-type H+-transporting ATPase subunit epsilon